VVLAVKLAREFYSSRTVRSASETTKIFFWVNAFVNQDLKEVLTEPSVASKTVTLVSRHQTLSQQFANRAQTDSVSPLTEVLAVASAR